MRSAVGGSGVALLLVSSMLYAAASPGAAPAPVHQVAVAGPPSPLRELRAAQPALGRRSASHETQGRVLVRPTRGTSTARLTMAVGRHGGVLAGRVGACLLYTSDAADE